MLCSKAYIVSNVIYGIVCQPTISYTIYSNVRHRSHIVGKDNVLANRMYDIVGHIVYNIVGLTYTICCFHRI